ncbi:MAG: bifunctional diaminohydroxyphosphoribosylaminopyrimidine deaminase/5-amino-6-(5-phosphoribosylamino)uracil reductase RibD [Deltaproteobacteria bacterium]
MSNETLDIKFMRLALRLARRAEGMTSPNPIVGAVIVKNGEVIGAGYHKKAGLPHAEIEALADAQRNGRAPSGGALYVTLEPCCHTGKRTPPCADAVIKAGISRVIVGCLDPNPKVAGRGVEILRQSSIEVVTGALERECRRANEAFFKFITSGMPFVTLKAAATLDGKIATSTGDSKWIGSERQRRYAHRLRSRADVVLVGVGTVIADNPRLNVRLRGASRQPAPVVLDSHLRIPLEAALLKIHTSPIIATTRHPDSRNRLELERMGARVITAESDAGGRIDLRDLMAKLGEMGVMSVLVEGGSEVAASFLGQSLADKIVLFYAPKIVGGSALCMVGELEIPRMAGAIAIEQVSVKSIGAGEFMVEGYIRNR